MVQDPELAALEQELAGTGGEPPKTPPAPETPPKGEEPPKGKEGEGEQPPKEEDKGVEGEDKGATPPDPLTELAKDPKFLQRVLGHPVLGPKFNKWADGAAAAQVKAATERGPTEAEVRQKVREEQEDKFFDGLSEEDLAEELKNKDAAAAYGRYQLRKEQKASTPSPGEMEHNIKVYATANLIQTYQGLIADSDLTDEVKEELQPQNFTKHGEGALVEWGKAIYTSLVESAVQKRFDTEWESEKESRLAELDGKRPAPSGGRPPGQMPDLMKTDSTEGLEQALAAESQKKK